MVAGPIHIGIALPFQSRAQIGDAPQRPDHLCAVVGPAAERNRHCARVGSAGRQGRDCPRRNCRRRGWLPMPCYGMSASGRSMMRWWLPAKMSPNSMSMAVARSTASFAAIADFETCVPPSLLLTRCSNTQARSHRSRCSTISSTPTPIASVARRLPVPVERIARRQGARLACAIDPGVRVDRGRHRFLGRGRRAGRIDRAGAGAGRGAADRDRRSPFRGRSGANDCAMVLSLRSPVRRTSGKSTLMNSEPRDG